MPKSKKRVKTSVASTPKAHAASVGAAIDVQAILDKAQGKPIVLQLMPSDKTDLPMHQRYRGDAYFPLRGVVDMQRVALGDASCLAPLEAMPDGFFQAIYLSNLLERLYPHQRSLLFAQLARLLAAGGELLVSTPDAQMAASYAASGLMEEPLFRSPLGEVSASDIFYGLAQPIAQGQLQAVHHSGLTARVLAAHLSHAGFSNIDITRRWLDLWCLCHRYEKGDERASLEAKIKVDLSHPSAHYPPLPPGFQFQHPGSIQGYELTDDLDAPAVQYQPMQDKH